jgi:hypothetical protein
MFKGALPRANHRGLRLSQILSSKLMRGDASFNELITAHFGMLWGKGGSALSVLEELQ